MSLTPGTVWALASVQPLWPSLLILAVSALGLVYALLAFAHARIVNTDMNVLQSVLAQLREQGALSAHATPIDAFQAVHLQLAAIAPGVFLRQQPWIHLYFQVLRLAHAWPRLATAMENEIARLNACQAARYCLALDRLAAIRLS